MTHAILGFWPALLVLAVFLLTWWVQMRKVGA